MKAVIFNSGLGNRMGDFTRTHHKSMSVLKNGETIFHRQIRLLSAEGVEDFIITTGPFEEQLIEETKDFPNLNFTFVRNDIYDKTNYIYSMYLAREYMDDDLIFLQLYPVRSQHLRGSDQFSCTHLGKPLWKQVWP